ncbi:ApeI family dehydratase [Dongshaea marina]|uniref:ApeI family dehydratase n=1 Tax=Dongshaea marina TaxID=2047966 RepID=UPI000D3ECA16|nr:hydroxymyristoyl-ACP dehydratase [Dongshaea marina]
MKLPIVEQQQLDHPEAILSLELPGELLYFKGHFPDHPLLPGVVQIHWAIHYAKELLQLDSEFAGMEVIKFQNILTPERKVQLKLRWDQNKHKLHFSYIDPDSQLSFSSGRINFSAIS